MNGYLCYKNHDCCYFDTNVTNMKKLCNDLEYALIELHSHLFGRAYMCVSPKALINLLHVDKITLKYDFYDGSFVDDDDAEESGIITHNKYKYTSPDELFSKIADIAITEDVLNSNFWVHDSYPCYIFDNLSITMRRHNGKKDINLSYNDFLTKIKDFGDKDNPLPTKKFIHMERDGYQEVSWENKRTRFGVKSGRNFVYYGEGIFFEVESKFYKKIKNLNFETKIGVYSYDENDQEEYDGLCDRNTMLYTYKRFSKKDKEKQKKDKDYRVFHSDITDILLACFMPVVVEAIENNNEVYYYTGKANVTSINHEKSDKPIFNFAVKYFIGLREIEVNAYK